MLRLFHTRCAFFALIIAGLCVSALVGVYSHGWGGGLVSSGAGQWVAFAGCCLLLAGGVAWARYRKEEWLPRAGALWSMAALAGLCCLAAMLSPVNPPGQLPLSALSMLGSMCLLWVMLRHVSLLFWWLFFSLEIMQRVGYHTYGSRINSLVLAETFEASADEALAYLESSNMFFFVGSIVAGGVLCWLIWLVLRRQKMLPLANLAMLSGGLACLYGATLPEAPSWRQRDAYWPLMEARELGAAWGEALFHNHATIRQVESLPSPAQELSSLETLHGGEGVALVVHIGESVRADRMSVNGYERDTTPWLRRLPRLINYSNCISAACDTCQAQIAILTDARRDIYEKDPAYVPHTGSVLDLFVAHGFKMYSFFGRRSATHLKYDRVVRLLTSKSEERFHAPGSPWTSVPQIADLLRRTDPKQNLILFINNEGSHTPFEHYDRESPPFLPVGGRFENPAAHADEVNNAYDATVHYTDEFVRRVVQQLQGRPWVYLYISDHGEYLGHDGIWGRAGLGESNRDYHSTTGCRVGMFVLTSPEFEQLHSHFARSLRALAQHRELCVGQEHIFHTLLGLFDLRTPWYNPSLDLTAPQVQPYTGPRPEVVAASPGASDRLVLRTSWRSRPWEWRHEEWATAVSVGGVQLSAEDTEVVLRGLRLRKNMWKWCSDGERPTVPPGAPLLQVSCDFPIDEYAIVRGLGLVWRAGENMCLLAEEKNTPFWDTLFKYVDMLPGGPSFTLWPGSDEGALDRARSDGE